MAGRCASVYFFFSLQFNLVVVRCRFIRATMLRIVVSVLLLVTAAVASATFSFASSTVVIMAAPNSTAVMGYTPTVVTVAQTAGLGSVMGFACNANGMLSFVERCPSRGPLCHRVPFVQDSILDAPALMTCLTTDLSVLLIDFQLDYVTRVTQEVDGMSMVMTMMFSSASTSARIRLIGGNGCELTVVAAAGTSEPGSVYACNATSTRAATSHIIPFTGLPVNVSGNDGEYMIMSATAPMGAVSYADIMQHSGTPLVEGPYTRARRQLVGIGQACSSSAAVVAATPIAILLSLATWRAL